MKNIRHILISYILKERFLFEKVFNKHLVILELLSVLDLIQMCISGGMPLSQVMVVINNINDDSFTSIPNASIDFTNIRLRILGYKGKTGKDGYLMALEIINTTLREEL